MWVLTEILAMHGQFAAMQFSNLRSGQTNREKTIQQDKNSVQSIHDSLCLIVLHIALHKAHNPYFQAYFFFIWHFIICKQPTSPRRGRPVAHDGYGLVACH